MRKFLIDTDTASDDAVAMCMALAHPDIDVLGFTVVAGNVPLDQAVQNALYTVELCGAVTPVYAGAPVPMARDLQTAQEVHGIDGMGDIGLPLSGRTPADGWGPQVIVDTIRANPGEVTLVAIGPLTNLAIALLWAPDIAEKVERVVIMGGTGEHGPGNKRVPRGRHRHRAGPDAGHDDRRPLRIRAGHTERNRGHALPGGRVLRDPPSAPGLTPGVIDSVVKHAPKIGVEVAGFEPNDRAGCRLIEPVHEPHTASEGHAEQQHHHHRVRDNFDHQHV